MKIHEIIVESITISEAETKDKAIKLLKGLGIAGIKGVRGLWWAINNPGKTIGLAVAVTNPKATWNAANFSWNLITDPAKVTEILSKYAYNKTVPWGDVKSAQSDLNAILGNSATSDFIFHLAELAVRHSLPIMGVIALLYGGKMFIDYIKTKDADPGQQAFQRISHDLEDNSKTRLPEKMEGFAI